MWIFGAEEIHVGSSYLQYGALGLCAFILAGIAWAIRYVVVSLFDREKGSYTRQVNSDVETKAKQTELLTTMSATMAAQQMSCAKHAELVNQIDGGLTRTAKATERLVELQTVKHRDIEDIGNRVKVIESAIKERKT